ncbi:MAG TPA: energy transducer TonB [Myxococcota bacterium]|nr:energy transducer TonB [Myxococcota bacterium]
MDRNKQLAIFVVVSLLLHVAVIEFTPRRQLEAPTKPARKVAPVPIEVRKQQIAELLAKPPAPDPDPEPVPERAPVPEPAPAPAPAKKPLKQPQSKPASQPKPPKPAAEPEAKKPEPEAKPTEPKKPAPLVLSNVALNGGVAVQTGEQTNLFGDPSVDARGFKRDGPDAPRVSQPEATAEQKAPEKVVIVPPKAQNQVQGVYPNEHRELGRVVRVTLQLHVDADGKVAKAEVTKGDLEAFNVEAKRAVEGLRFSPATKNGQPIAYKVKWTVVFLPQGS